MIGFIIRKNRKKLALSQEEFAKLVGVTTKAVQTWELNKQKPKLSNIKKIAKVLKIEVTELTQYLED